MSTSDNDWISYLAGDQVEALDPVDRVELDELRALLANRSSWVSPPDHLEGQVVAAIASEAASLPAAEVAERSAIPSQAHDAPRRRARLPSLTRQRIGLAFAGLAAVAIAAIVIAVGSSGGGSTPLHFAMVVEGTALDPGAHGHAQLTKTPSGWEIQLRVTGLPHLENGRYYQGWLRNAAGILVPVGTFNDGRRVTLWSGVPVTTFRTLTVTRQAADGNPASSGQRVLTGTITGPG